jgi:predicted ATPase
MFDALKGWLPMINSVEIHNFKNLRDLRIDLERLTVFVGANASGKTSVLDAIHLAVRAATPQTSRRERSEWKPRPEKVFGWERHCDWFYTRGGSGDMRISCATPGGTFSVTASPPPGFPPPQTELYGKGVWHFRTSPPEPAPFEDALRPARSIVFLHLNATKLAKPTYSDRSPPRVEYDGEGLAAVLAFMALNDPDGFESLVEEMRKLVPHLKRIRFTKMPVQRLERELVRFGDEAFEHRARREFQGDVILFDFVNANNVSAQTASEGTLMLLGLLTVLLGPSKPGILLLDDIEHGLHPVAQTSLLAVLNKVMNRFPELQILASAHSPYLLDGLQPEQVRLMATGADGYSVCGRLTDHPEFDKWKDEMAAGELWSLFGENWLADGAGANRNDANYRAGGVAPGRGISVVDGGPGK